jgi:hypothetical protein
MISAMTVPPETREFLAERHAAVMELALWLRSVVLAAEPDLTERVYRGWEGIGFRHPDAGYVCAIYPRSEQVRLLFEHGVRLSDPEGLLEGEGTQTRYVPVRAPDENAVPALSELVRDAVAERLFRR